MRASLACHPRMAAAAMVLVSAALSVGTPAGTWSVHRIAGGGPDGLPPLLANVDHPIGLAIGADDTQWVVSDSDLRLYRIAAGGTIAPFAGRDADDLDGHLDTPLSVVLSGGTMFVGDAFHRIVRRESGSGNVTSWDTANVEGRAIEPRHLAVAPDGAVLFTAGSGQHPLVARLDVATGQTSIVVGGDCLGGGCAGDGDGGPASSAALVRPAGLAFDAAGHLYIADAGDHRVRRVDADTGLVSTLAGTGVSGYDGDGGPASAAALGSPGHVAVEGGGNVFIGDALHYVVRRVDAATGVIDTYAGTGTFGFAGDGGPATDALLGVPGPLAVDGTGALVIADGFHHRLRRVDPSDGTIDTVAGNGTQAFSGDGFPATRAAIHVREYAIDTGGDVLIAGLRRIRVVDAETGLIDTAAGTGSLPSGPTGNAAPALDTPLDPISLAAGPGRLVYIANKLAPNSHEILRLDRDTGLLDTVVAPSTGIERIFSAGGDGLYIKNSFAIQEVDPATGDRTIVAGGGTIRAADGILATSAAFAPRIQQAGVSAGGSLWIWATAPWTVFEVDLVSGRLRTLVGGNDFCLDATGPPGPAPCTTTPALGSAFLGGGGSEDPFGNLYFSSFSDRLVRLNRDTGLLTVELPDATGRMCCPLAEADGDVLFASNFNAANQALYRATNLNQPPVAIADSGPVPACEGPAGSLVELDGTASFDPDSTPGTSDDIVFTTWSVVDGPTGPAILGRTAEVDALLPVGTSDLALTVIDRFGRAASDPLSVTVADDEDPDADGIGSCADNCPVDANPDQADADGNGVGDACDLCDEGAGDSDGDGVCDDTDNCPVLPGASQDDGDGDGVGDVCDVCPALANPDQSEAGACLRFEEDGGACVMAEIDLAGEGRGGWMTLTRVDRRPLDAVELSLLYASCADETLELYLNGVLLGSVQLTATPSCASCAAFGRTVRFDDVATLAGAWRPAEPNELRLIKADGDALLYVANAIVQSQGESETACLVGPACGTVGSCGDAPPFDRTTSLDNPFVVHTEVEAWRFRQPTLTRQLDISELPDGEYRVCAAAEATPPAGLVAAGVSGRLYDLDTAGGPATFAGWAPAVPAAVEFDPATGESILAVQRAFVQPGLLQRFDLRAGAILAPSVPSTPLPDLNWIQALEFVGGDLYGLVTESYLYTLDPLTGAAALVDSLGTWKMTGIASRPGDGSLVALGRNANQPVALALVDVVSGDVEEVGRPGVEVRRLSEGPDGLLYAMSSPALGSTLYRIDPLTGLTVAVGDTGIPEDVAALTLVGEPGTVDCAAFHKQGESVLAFNGSCGSPVAAIATAAAVECTSPDGATVLLDGTASSDPNASPGTQDSLVAYEWFEDFREPTQVALGTGAMLPVPLTLGEHDVTLRVTNVHGESDLAAATISVVDTSPPQLTVQPDETVLWPPDHTLRALTLEVSVADACSVAGFTLASVVSDEPDDAPGPADGATTGDIQGVEPGTADLAFALRRERSIDGNGRTYSVTYTAMDAGGNATDHVLTIGVPLHPPLDADIRLDATAGGTLLTWDPVPGALRYDVIRGSLGSLAFAADEVDLGSVACVEAASGDTTTAGFEDPQSPAVGAPLFYLVQYHDGTDRGFGTDGSARLRVPAAAGFCMPARSEASSPTGVLPAPTTGGG